MCAAAALLTSAANIAQAAMDSSSTACKDAWATYNDFKSRTAMEPSQYPLTIQGAAVRAACGKSALPAPPNADRPPRHHIRRHHVPLRSPAAPVAPALQPGPETSAN